MMTKEELLARLSDTEWNDFEVKEASGGLPKSMWETVSAFSNTAGGWIVLGVMEKKTADGPIFTVKGLSNPEQIEQDVIGTLRSRTKFNVFISCRTHRFDIDGKTVLVFEIPLASHRPVSIRSTGEVYIRTGSGDVVATDLEVDAIVRDCSFGAKSEQEVPWSGYADINLDSIASYRSYLRDFNRPLSYPTLDDAGFCRKLNIMLSSGKLSYGSLLMFGKRDAILRAFPNFWIDYMEIPGDSYATALKRYTYRMPEQENIWESFQLIMHRLRNFVDAPYVEGPDIFGMEDNSRLFCLREGLVNFCAHSDFFAAAHPTVRVFDDRIVMQNPGRFILAAEEFRTRILSMPRNPNIIRFFRHPRLSENAGYGIDKILKWESLTGKSVKFESDMLISTVTYPLGCANILHDSANRDGGKTDGNGGKTDGNGGKTDGNGGKTDGNGGNEETVLNIIRKNPKMTQPQIAMLTGFSERKVNRITASLKQKGKLIRIGKTKGGYWQVNV